MNLLKRGMAGRRPELPRHGDTFHVEIMNSYAVFMGYLSMAIKGLGFLVLTWTTVVLLGGFVSTLRKKDFWCLTFITLVQTAGIFDVVLNKKLGYMKKSVDGLIVTFGQLVLARRSFSEDHPCASTFLVFVLVSVQMLVLLVIFCPLAIIYVFGILMSGGISLWRLIEHDYSDGEASNLEPAMNTLYYLALLQGCIFCYRFICALSEKGIANRKAFGYSLDVVSNYLRETRKGCEMDPSFANGRNLITHAIDMIGSNSPVDCIFGVKILYTAICIPEKERETLSKQHVLMKHLLLSASSFTHIIKKLLEMLDTRGLHDRETRYQAAKIVGDLAFNISLEQFPQGIQHISSMIGTFEQYSIAEPYQQDCVLHVFENHGDLYARSVVCSPDTQSKLEKDYKHLLLRGLHLIWKLASNENNCRVMGNTPDLVSKIMAPITSDLLHQTTDDHGAWSDIVEGSMDVACQLTGAGGEIGSKLRREISGHKEAITAMEMILTCNKCNNCNEELQRKAIWILTQLYMDTEYRKSNFVRMLLAIFSHASMFQSTRAYAGGALSVICSRGGIRDATVLIQTSYDVVDQLTKILVHYKNKTCRQGAAEILKHLCTHYTNDDQYLGKLKKAMSDAVPEVIGAIVRAEGETYTEEETQKQRFNKPATDMQEKLHKIQWEIFCQDPEVSKYFTDNRPTGQGIPTRKKNAEQPVWPANLLSSFLSFCETVYDRFTSELGPDLAPVFHASSFLNKLKEMLVGICDPTVENLLLFKAIAKMVISMMKHSGNRSIKQEDLESLIEALSNASKIFLVIDYSMVFHSTISSESKPSRLDKCTLASLVKEAREWHAKLPSTLVSG